MRRTRKKLIAALGVAVVVVAVATAAFAYFTSTGDGTGSASVGSSTNWNVAVTSDTGHGLLPGSGSETLNYTITNESAGAQALTAVTASVKDDGSGNVLDNGTAVPGCKVLWFHATASAPSPVLGTSITHLGTATGTVTVTMDDSGGPQDQCQGITGPDVNVHAA